MIKKISLFLIITATLSLTSCGEAYRLDNKPGIVWKCDFFNFTMTYNELQQTLWQEEKIDYSTLEIDGIEYSCYICFDWATCGFFVCLFDENTGEEISFFGEKNDGKYQYFLVGTYDRIIEERNKEYIYSCKVHLSSEDYQYYDYCVANNLECPKVINFYGYEEK